MNSKDRGEEAKVRRDVNEICRGGNWRHFADDLTVNPTNDKSHGDKRRRPAKHRQGVPACEVLTYERTPNFDRHQDRPKQDDGVGKIATDDECRQRDDDAPQDRAGGLLLHTNSSGFADDFSVLVEKTLYGRSERKICDNSVTDPLSCC